MSDTAPATGHTGATVSTPLGPVPKQGLTLGLAAVAAVVVYAWWRQRSAATAATAAQTAATDAALTPATAFTPAPTGDSTVTATSVPQPSTNGQWTQQAVSYLAGIGYDPGAVATALGLYLARKPVTASQESIIQAARAAIGEPPTGGPYPIVSALGGVPTGTPPTGTFTYRVTGHNDTSVSTLIHTVFGTPYSDVTEYSLLANQILALNPSRSSWGARIPTGTLVTLPGSGPHHIA